MTVLVDISKLEPRIRGGCFVADGEVGAGFREGGGEIVSVGDFVNGGVGVEKLHT